MPGCFAVPNSLEAEITQLFLQKKRKKGDKNTFVEFFRNIFGNDLGTCQQFYDELCAQTIKASKM